MPFEWVTSVQSNFHSTPAAHLGLWPLLSSAVFFGEIISGAGGNILNITQIACAVGQQALWSKRINFGYTNRTLSFFKEDDLTPKARGFVHSSYLNGLLPYEFFFGSITGRDGLMDTALRTPKSGYLYRRLANALQDLKVEYDFTVRDNRKVIIQFTPGEDGIDPAKSDWGKLDVRNIVQSVLR